MARENGAAPMIKFNIDAMTALEVGIFMENVGGRENIHLMSDVLARIVTECPSEWGPKDKPETYQNISWRLIWKKVIFPGIREALKNDESE